MQESVEACVIKLNVVRVVIGKQTLVIIGFESAKAAEAAEKKVQKICNLCSGAKGLHFSALSDGRIEVTGTLKNFYIEGILEEYQTHAVSCLNNLRDAI